MVTDPGHQTIDKIRVCHLLATYCDGRTKSKIKNSKDLEGAGGKGKEVQRREAGGTESGRMGRREMARL